MSLRETADRVRKEKTAVVIAAIKDALAEGICEVNFDDQKCYHIDEVQAEFSDIKLEFIGVNCVKWDAA